MAVTVSDLRELVNSSAPDEDALQQCFQFGTEVVTRYTRRVPDGVIPEVVRDEAVLAAAADQFERRKAPNGILNATFNDDGTPVYIGRDPLAAVRPILKPWISVGGVGSVRLTRA